MTPAHSLLQRLTKAALVAALLCGAATSQARANQNCVGEGQAQLCPPLVTKIESPPNAIIIHWLTQGGVPPDRVVLVSEGTLARRFADGRILASENSAGTAGGFASYVFALPAPAGASFPTLHLLGVWGNATLASVGFSAATSRAENNSPPVITSSGFQDDLMRVAWTAGRNWPR
jgi:hypothetical protein